MKIQDLIKRSQQDVTEGTKQEILFYAKLPDGSKVYARVKDEEQWADLQQKYRGAEIKTFDYNRPDVLDWLEARRINLRKFVPGMVQTMYESAEEKQRLDPTCWDGYKKSGTKLKGNTRVNNCVPESLEEIDRRGFLKGMGAAAMTGAAGSAVAAPFKHGEYTDQMTDKNVGKYSAVRSNDGLAELEIAWGDGVWFVLKTRAMLEINKVVSGEYRIQYFRYSFNGKLVEESGIVNKQLRSMQIGSTPDASKALANKLLKQPGEFKIEIELFGEGKRVFKFKIEPDSVSKSSPDPDKQQVKKDEPISKSSEPAEPSVSYAGRIRARIKPNIVFTSDVDGNPVAEVEVRATTDGTITSQRLVKSSGNKAWDDAVIKAIIRTETLPRDTDGRVWTPLIISFRPKD